jgi:DNA-directed RNA polymerase subunit M
MQFCPKCGAVLIKKTKNLGCPRCGYSSKEKADISTSEKIESKGEIGVVSEKDGQILPVVYAECKKCGNNRAYFWTVQTRSSDEAETKFFKCTKCNATWREYR